MNALVASIFVTLLVLAGLLPTAVPALRPVLLVALPYAAVAAFVIGMVVRVVGWARSPVPFHIPTVSGQQRSLPWIRSSRLESPWSSLDVVGRMALEVLLFRSLFRNTRAAIEDNKLTYDSSKWLWLGALAMHYAMLVVLLRHLRLFLDPVPAFVVALDGIDGFFQVGLPVIYLTSLVFLGSLAYLLGRRLFSPRIRYISLVSDYFPLLLMLVVAASGFLLRHLAKTDIAGVKTFVMSLVGFSPAAPDGLHYLFAVHLVLVSSLFLYFPMSKLVHLGGVFLSPTRNLANNSRAVRHVNPWNPHVEVHTYQEYEDEFRDRMKSAGIPVERE